MPDARSPHLSSAPTKIGPERSQNVTHLPSPIPTLLLWVVGEVRMDDRLGLKSLLVRGIENRLHPRQDGRLENHRSLGFADPDAKVGFGYVMNRMGPHILVDPRATALIDAVYASLS